MSIDTHGWLMPFGRHKGERITRVPISYLFWMVNEKLHGDVAQAELDRRGTVRPTLDVSGHAIDRASMLCLKLWKGTHLKGEWLHAWVVRLAQGAINESPVNGKRVYAGMKWVFKDAGEWPVLVTVMPLKRR